MEPAAAAAATAGLFLAGSEQQFYAELFALCCGGSCQTVPEAGTGAAPAAGGSKVAELFRASQLPPETLHQNSSGFQVFQQSVNRAWEWKDSRRRWTTDFHWFPQCHQLKGASE
uniref:Uncharacterized protein n=1 Tax=Sphaerodactylus townsendi TaxID=933632 RepID=A0ACB8FJ40_9SAUR